MSLPCSVGVFRWLCLQCPSCSLPQWGWRVVCVGRVCTWGFVNLCVAQEHTTHLLSTQMLWVFETLLSACTCQLVLTQG